MADHVNRTDPVKLSARERLQQLFDPGTFLEMFRYAKERPAQNPVDDGVVCGHGDVNGQPVIAYATEFSVQGGSLGALQTRQIAECQRFAHQSGIPIVALLESGGARISEAVHIMEGFVPAMTGGIELSGVVPQIACVFGPCIGASAFMATFSDWVIMETESSLSIAGARVNAMATGENLSDRELGGVTVHTHDTGNVHFVEQGDQAVLERARELLQWLPPHYKARPAVRPFSALPVSEQQRKTPEIARCIPADSQTGFDMRKVVQACADHQHFFETQADFAPNLLTGFIELGGYTLAVVASQPLHLGGVLDVKATRKMTRFLTFIAAFNYPLLSLVDVPGALPTLASQRAGILTHMTQAMHAIYNVRSLKITVVVRRCFGGTYSMLHPKSSKGDLVFAYPGAMIGVMSDAAMHQIMQHSEKGQRQIQKLESLGLRTDAPQLAAAAMYIDDIIDPEDTRQVLYRSLKSFYHKRRIGYPDKLQGNPPR